MGNIINILYPPERQIEGASDYYRDRLKEICKERYSEITAGKSKSQIHGELQDIIEDEAWFVTREVRISNHLEEAEGLVTGLEGSHLDDDYTEEKLYKISYCKPWREQVRLYHKGLDPSIMIKERMNRYEMIERLRHISSDDFGDDPDAWRRWIEAWKLDPPTPGYR